MPGGNWEIGKERGNAYSDIDGKVSAIWFRCQIELKWLPGAIKIK